MKFPQRTEAGPLVYGKVNKREAAVLEFSKQLVAAEWDFTVDGNSDFPTFGVKLPADCIVTDCWLDIIQAVGAGTVQLALNGSSVISVAQLVNAALLAKPNLTVAAGVKVATPSELGLYFSAAPTAGKIRVYVEFMKKP